MIKELIAKTRTYRRFNQEIAISTATLEELLELARLAGSARNSQPLRYITVCDPQVNSRIFPLLGWAGYLPDWPEPMEGERPTAYIICLSTEGQNQFADFDLGIASQNILLGATDKGLGGCRIASISPKLRAELEVPADLKIELVIALGQPKENVIIEEVGPEGKIKYWRDEEQTHHVPKRQLNEIVIKRY